MTASLLTHDGNVVQTQTTGEQGTIQTRDWIKVCFTFKDYGPGVRSVSIETTGNVIIPTRLKGKGHYWYTHISIKTYLVTSNGALLIV